MSASPNLSPTMEASLRQHSVSPPPQPQQVSKRDKKRTQLHDRLNDMTAAFSANRDHHCRDQLHAIQVDINLITNADPHSDNALPDSPEAIDEMVKNEVQRMMMRSLSDKVPLRAGRIYADFSREVNDAMEEKDAQLAQLKRNFDHQITSISKQHTYKRKLANAEHKALSTTLRDRLINSVASKKARLSKDKEALEITNETTYLLHPSQYGLANPASPGGIHGKRATRHRRDAEELSSLAPDGQKRKRKAQDDDESPAPTRQRLENGSRTPLWQAEKNHNRYLQFGTNLFSIEKLFTEKELSLIYNNSALASFHYMHRPTQTDSDVISRPNENTESKSENGKAGAPAADADGDEPGSPQGGVGMERQYSHVTRSTRGNYLQTGLGYDLPDVNYPATFDPLAKNIPRLPPMINFAASRNLSARTDIVANVQGLSAEDTALELESIRKARAYNDEHGIGKNLEDTVFKRMLNDAAFPRSNHYLLDSFPSKGNYGYGSRSDNKHGMQSHHAQESNVRGEISNVRDEPGGIENIPALSGRSSRGVSVV